MAPPRILQTALSSGAQSTAQHPHDLRLETEVRRPSPDHQNADSLETLRQLQNQGHRTLIFCLCSSIKSFHFHQASQSTRYFCCHFSTSGALRASHQRINVGICAIGLSHVTFFGIRKNIVVQTCCGHLPHCSTFSKNSTISPLISFGKSRGSLGWNPSHPTLSLLCTFLLPFPSRLLSTSAALPHISSTPHSSRVCLSCSVPPHHIASVLTILSFFCLTTAQQPRILFFFLPNQCSSSIVLAL